MRNLKKVLSLALALVMLLGMMVVGAGAAAPAPGGPGEPPAGAPNAADENKTTTYADLTDNGEIQNVEAVSLMVDLGIINGIPQADDTVKYEPARTVDRATMSKLIFYVLTGEDDATSYVGINTGLTDVDDSWAKGFINYCYGTKLIAGDGLGHFFPENTLNVAQGAKMLLTALGYDADSCGFQGVGEDWAINVMTYANNAGLLTGLKKLSAVDDLSRDNAAQMVFNALNAKTVEVESFTYVNGKRVVTSYKNGETLGYESYGLVKVTAAVTGIDKDGNIVIGDATVEDVSATGMDKVKLPGTADMIGSTVTFYAQGKIGKRNSDGIPSTVAVAGAVSSAATPTVSDELYTSYGDKGFDKLIDKSPTNRDFKVEMDDEVDYYVNDRLQADDDEVIAAQGKIGTRGVVSTFIDTTGNGKANVVKIVEKKVATLSADPTTRTSGNDVQVRLPGVTDFTSFNADNTVKSMSGWEDLKKGDVVLYVKMADGVTYFEPAASVEGKVEGNNNTKGLQINGKYYTESQLVNTNASVAGIVGTFAGWNNFKDEYVFYLDDAENIVKIVSVDNAAATESNYAVVQDVAWFAGNGFSPNGHMEAVLMFTDGTTKTVTVDSVDGVEPVEADIAVDKVTDDPNTAEASTQTLAAVSVQTTETLSTSVTTIGAGKYVVTGTGTTDATITGKYFGANSAKLTEGPTALVVLDQFYEYEEDDGVYTLTNVPAAGLAKMAITNGKAAFDGTNVGNANTVFIFDNGEGKTPDIYVGIANVPSTSSFPSNNVTDHSDLHTIVKDASGIAKFVFVQGVTVSNASTDVVYIADEEDYSITAAGKVFSAWINGEAGTITVASNDAVINEAGLYTVSGVNGQGVSTVAKVVADTTVNAKTAIKSTEGDLLVIGTNTAFTYDENTTVYVFAKNGPRTSCTQVGIADLEADADDIVFVIVDKVKTDRADTVYVVKVDPAPPEGPGGDEEGGNEEGGDEEGGGDEEVDATVNPTGVTSIDKYTGTITVDFVHGATGGKMKVAEEGLVADGWEITGLTASTITAKKGGVEVAFDTITPTEYFTIKVDDVTYYVQANGEAKGADAELELPLNASTYPAETNGTGYLKGTTYVAYAATDTVVKAKTNIGGNSDISDNIEIKTGYVSVALDGTSFAGGSDSAKAGTTTLVAGYVKVNGTVNVTVALTKNTSASKGGEVALTCTNGTASAKQEFTMAQIKADAVELTFTITATNKDITGVKATVTDGQ